MYRLFALSNFGSLLALIPYPPLIEPWIPTRAQSLGWSAGYVLFAALCAAAGFFSLRARSLPADGANPQSEPLADAPPPGVRDYVVWLLLAAMGSYMLLGVTNHITQNVASVSPWTPSRYAVTSTLMMSPSSITVESGMPWQMTSFSEVQQDFGKPL